MQRALHVGAFVLAAQFPGQGPGEALHRAVRAGEVAERAGLDAVWLAEHHFVPYGVCPSAVTLAALLLGRTQRIGVGTAVSVLPTLHPVALGEQAALLHLTSGRAGSRSASAAAAPGWIWRSSARVWPRTTTASPNRSTCCCAGCANPAVGADGERFSFREVAVVPRPSEALAGLDRPATAHPAPGGGRLHLALLGPACRGARSADAARHALRRRGEGGHGRPVAVARALEAGRDERRTWRRPSMSRRAWCRSPTAQGTRPRRWRSRCPAGSAGAGCPCAPSTAAIARCVTRWRTPSCCAGCIPSARPRCAPTGSRRRRSVRACGGSRCSSRASGDLAATEENVRRLGAEILPQLG